MFKPACKLTTLVWLFLTPLVSGAPGDIWDAKAQWSDLNNPAGPWSYRTTAGNLLLRAASSTIGGGPAGWSADGTANTIPSLFNDNWTPGGSHTAAEFAGHGPWLVRWTSPITGNVKITGSFWQKFAPERRLRYRLRQNSFTCLAEGFIPEDAFGNTIIGRAGIVVFTPLLQHVAAGDTIDLIVDGAAPGGDGENIFAVAAFKIEEIGIASVPSPANNSSCVPLDTILTWSPAADAIAHNVYLGTDFNAVSNAADPSVSPGRGTVTINAFDPGPLAYGTTCYWRIDKVSSLNVL